MKKLHSDISKLFKMFVIVAAFVSPSLSFAQLSGPTPVCADVYNTYSVPGISGYNRVTWTITNGSFTGATINKASVSAKFTANGKITINYYDENEPGHIPPVILVGSESLNVNVHTVGTLSNPGTPNCPTFNLTRVPGTVSSYAWERSNFGANSWTQISTSGSTTIPVTMTQKSDFRVKSTQCPTPIYSNIVTTDIKSPPSSGGTISGNATVCQLGTPPVFGNVASPTPSNAPVQWQYSENQTTWYDIAGATSLTMSVQYVPVTRYYRRVAKWECSTAVTPSNVITVTVNNYSATGTLSASPTSVCESGIVTLTAPGLVTTNTSWEYRYSNDGGSNYSSWTQYSTSNSSPTTLNVSSNFVGNRTYQFRVTATNGVCNPLISNTGTVTVNSNYIGQPSATYIDNIGPAIGSLSLNNIPVGATFQQWQQSTDNGANWSAAAGTNNSTAYNYNATGNILYRARALNGACSYQTSVNVNVKVFSVPIVSIQGGGSPEIAIGGSLTLQANTSYYDMQWTKDDSDIVGQKSNTLVVNSPGTYKLRVKASSISNTVTSAGLTVYSLGHSPTNPSGMNMTLTTVIKKAGVNTTTNLYNLSQSEYSQGVAYSDGLVRPVQDIAVGQSPTGRDIVQPYAYDPSAIVDYLPYATTDKVGKYRSNAIGATYTSSEQYLFFQSAPAIATDTAPFAKSIIENSPLRAVIEKGAPGSDWQPGGGHTVRVQAQANVANDVRIFTASGPAGYYTANTLSAIRTLDENGNAVYTFRDKAGREVLRRVQVDATNYLETYSVYDTRGNLSYQVPPKAAALINSGTTWTVSFRDQHCHTFNYDGKNRLVEKKVPDAASTYFVYDSLDRLVLTQDANLRSQNKWRFFKYDFNGRVAMLGDYVNTTATNRPAVQTIVNGLYTSTSTPYFESRGTTLHGYTNVSFPTANVGSAAPIDVMAVNYYNDYDFDQSGTDDFSYSPQSIAGEGVQASAVGLPTGSKRLVVGTSTWLYTYIFYDKFGRVIQAKSNNHLSSAVDNVITTIYDFEGKVLQTINYHNGGSSNQTTVVNQTTYDHAGRPTNIFQKINSEPQQLLSKYSYNELGQTIEKNLHQTGSGSFLQSVDYRYNIRGWLKSINNAQLNVDNSNNDTNDFFGMELLRNESDAGLGNTASFNGNISAIKWKGPGAPSGTIDRRSYKYTYDKSDRFTVASYQKYDTSSWNQEVGMLNENLTYDQNGNVLTLGRNRIKRTITSAFVISAVQEVLDQLTYTYSSSKSNQMEKIDDSGSLDGFKNGATQAYEYLYNGDGNLTFDQNKGISSIAYNQLNKVSVVTYSGSPTKTVTYTYDAAGTKLKTVTNDGTTTKTIDYIGAFVYENTTLSFISTPEGRVVKSGATFEYQYNITDHQGNTRVIFSSATPTPDTYTATFEDNTMTSEQSGFNNYPTGGNRSVLELFDHTDFSGTTYTYSQLLNGGNASQVGLTKTLKVVPGDQIHAEVYAKYWNESSTNSNITGFASALTSAFGLNAGMTGEALKAFNALNNYGGIVAGAGGTGLEGDVPKAYITVLLFDQNFNFVDAAFDRVTTIAEQVGASPKTDFELLSRDVIVTEPGYAYIYISNENPTKVDVYFDDLTITHSKSNVVQYNEYYPFGLQTQNSWTREGAKGNNFLYNEGSELNSLTGIYDTFLRGYDPALARFFQVDPYASLTVNFSVYHYASNNPVSHNDPTGGSDPILGFRGFTTLGFAAPYQDGHMNMPTGGGGSSNWSYDYNTVEENFNLMSTAEFERYYGVDLDTDEGKGWVSTAIASTPTAGDVRSISKLIGATDYDIDGTRAYFVVNVEPAVYCGSTNAEDQIKTGLYGVVELALAADRFGAGYDFAAGMGFATNVAELSRQGYGAVRYGSRLEGVEKALSNGRFLNYNGKYYSNAFKGNQYLNSKAVAASKQLFNSSATAIRTVGRSLTVVSVVASAYQLGASDMSGADVARFGASLLITGSAFIPVIGPFVSIGLGVLDSMGAFDSIYAKFD